MPFLFLLLACPTCTERCLRTKWNILSFWYFAENLRSFIALLLRRMAVFNCLSVTECGHGSIFHERRGLLMDFSVCMRYSPNAWLPEMRLRFVSCNSLPYHLWRSNARPFGQKITRFTWFNQIQPQIHKLLLAEDQPPAGDKKSSWVQGD